MKRPSGVPFIIAALWVLLSLCNLSGCCDGEVIVTGKVSDAKTGTPLDSVRVTMFENEKWEVNPSISDLTDSTGNFLLWNFGCFKNTRLFIVVSKHGYYSQSLTVDPISEVKIDLRPE